MRVHTNLRTEVLTAASRKVSEITNFAVPPNKAIVGANAFAHESGIHQHGVIKHRGTYEIIDAEMVGADASQIVLGKHSGRHGLRARLHHLGYELGENALHDLFVRFKELADTRKQIDDHDIIDLVEHRGVDCDGWLRLQALRMETVANGQCEAEVDLILGSNKRTGRGVGGSTFEAAAHAIRDALPHQSRAEVVNMIAYQEDSLPMVRVVLKLTNASGEGPTKQGSATDGTLAFVHAYVGALAKSLSSDEFSAIADDAAAQGIG